MVKQYTVAQAGVPSYAEAATPGRRQLHRVVNASGEVVESFRNKVLADRMAEASGGALVVKTFTF